jgi:hypothetical protein
LQPKDLPGWVNYAEKLGATPQEVVVVKETFEELEKDAYRLLREAYETFTGNKAPPEMSVDEVIFEIIRTGGYNDAPEVYQSIAEERAGLKEPPSKDAKMGPVEHLLRSILVQGDLYEAALAKKLGRERARELREKNQGWPGSASEWEGCPEVK